MESFYLKFSFYFLSQICPLFECKLTVQIFCDNETIIFIIYSKRKIAVHNLIVILATTDILNAITNHFFIYVNKVKKDKPIKNYFVTYLRKKH